MRKPVVIIGIILAAAGLGAALYSWQYVRVAGPPEEAKRPGGEPAADPASFPLKLRPGFSSGIFARGLPGARVLALDSGGNLLVAFHGSGNRTEPTGYKVVRYKLDDAGNFLDVEDFITGWLTPAGALGRPVDIPIKDDGVIFISDNQAGVVYRVSYSKPMAMRN